MIIMMLIDYNMHRCVKPTTFKVWSADRQRKKLVSASTMQELLRKGSLKATCHIMEHIVGLEQERTSCNSGETEKIEKQTSHGV